MSKISRRAILTGATGLAAVTGQAVVIPALADTKRNRNNKRGPVKASGDHKENGNYVPVTIAVPDSIEGPDSLYVTMDSVSGMMFSPSTQYSVCVRAVLPPYDGSALNNAILGYPNASSITITHYGEDNSNEVTFPVAISAVNPGVETLFKLQFSEYSDFHDKYTDLNDTGEIVLY